MRPFLTAGLLCALSVSLQAGTLLVNAPENKVGQKILTETTTDNHQILTINDQAIETKANTFAKTESVVESVSKEDVITTGKVTVLQINISLPGGQSANFDSGNPNAEAPAGPLGEMHKYFKTLSKSQWKTILGPDHKVKSVEYIENSLSDIPEAFQQDASPDRIKQEANQMLNRIPGKEVEKGDTWTLNEEQNLGSGQKFNVTRKFTYLGPEEHNGKLLEHIGYKTETVNFEIGAESKLPIQSKSSDLTVDSTEGHLWYDAEKKVIVESEEKFKVTGDLILVANGAELPTELNLTMHLKSVTTAE